jgi:hypothetical protein
VADVFSGPSQLRGQAGQASVEMVAALPAVLLVGLVVWQFALAGHTTWACANAARVGARAAVVGADAEAAARTALPEGLHRGLRVGDEGGEVRVRVRVPLVAYRWSSPVTTEAAARLGEPS